MSIDRDDLRMILTERYGREYDITEEDLDDILALDDAAPRAMVVHSEEEFRRRVQAELRAEAAEARLANIAELRDEMRTAGGAVVWIDDLDEFLDGAHPGAALTAEEAGAIRDVLAVSLETEPWNEPSASTLRALAARLGAQQ